MLLNRLRVAVVLLCLGIGGVYFTWQAFAGAADETVRVPATGQASEPKAPPPGRPPRTD